MMYRYYHYKSSPIRMLHIDSLKTLKTISIIGKQLVVVRKNFSNVSYSLGSVWQTFVLLLP